MNKTTILLGATALVLGVAAVLPQTAFAYKGDPTVKGPNYTPERHAAMTKAFANKDYNAWKALMAGKGATRKITAENFGKFATAHELALQGKVAEANALRAELGMGAHNGTGMGQGNGQSKMNR
jgi:hypothetical protein